jgi:heat shock protein HslJ
MQAKQQALQRKTAIHFLYSFISLSLIIAGFAGLLSCEQNSTTIAGKSWQVLALNGIAVDRNDFAEMPFLYFHENGRASGFAGCNRLRAEYQLRGKSLSFGRIASTRMMCPQAKWETAMHKALELCTNYTLHNDTLYLQLEKAKLLTLLYRDINPDP